MCQETTTFPQNTFNDLGAVSCSLITVQLYSLNIFLHIPVSLLPTWVHDTNARLCRKSTAWGHFQRLHASPSLQPAASISSPSTSKQRLEHPDTLPASGMGSRHCNSLIPMEQKKLLGPDDRN